MKGQEECLPHSHGKAATPFSPGISLSRPLTRERPLWPSGYDHPIQNTKPSAEQSHS